MKTHRISDNCFTIITSFVVFYTTWSHDKAARLIQGVLYSKYSGKYFNIVAKILIVSRLYNVFFVIHIKRVKVEIAKHIVQT